MKLTIDTFIGNIVSAAVSILRDAHGFADPSDDTLRAVRIHVEAMFNWTMQRDAGHVGWQMQILYAVIVPAEARPHGFDLHTIGSLVTLFDTQLTAWQDYARAEREERLAELRARLQTVKDNAAKT